VSTRRAWNANRLWFQPRVFSGGKRRKKKGASSPVKTRARPLCRGVAPEHHYCNIVWEKVNTFSGRFLYNSVVVTVVYAGLCARVKIATVFAGIL